MTQLRWDGTPDDRAMASPDRIARLQWRNLRRAVDRAVTNADPEGLLAAGSPADEYDTEVDQLTGLVSRTEPTRAEVLRIWSYWFDTDNNLARKPSNLDELVAALTDARQLWLSYLAEQANDRRGR